MSEDVLYGPDVEEALLAKELPGAELVRGVGVGAIPIELPGDRNVFEVKLRDPGIVRACAYWYKKPAVLGSSSMRGVELVPHPMLFVEMSPEGQLRVRRFAFVKSDDVFDVQPGYEARYCATAIGQHGAGHLFEIVKVST